MVVAKPRAPGVERGLRTRCVRECLQDRLGPGAAGEVIRERAAHLVEQPTSAEQLAHPRPAGTPAPRPSDRPRWSVRFRELPYESIVFGMPCQRERCESQAGRPALGPFVQERHRLLRQLDAAGPRAARGPPRCLKQKISAPQLPSASPARRSRCSPSPGSSRVARTRRRRGRQLREEELRAGRAPPRDLSSWRSSIPDRIARASSTPGQHPGDPRPPLRTWATSRPVPTGPLRRPPRPTSLQRGQPEPLRVLLSPLDRHPRCLLAAHLQPAAQQHGLAAAGGAKRAQPLRVKRPRAGR